MQLAMADGCGSVAARGGRREMRKRERRVRRQARGGFKTRLRRQNAHGAWPARSAIRRRVAHTCPAFSENGGTVASIQST